MSLIDYLKYMELTEVGRRICGQLVAAEFLTTGELRDTIVHVRKEAA